LSALLIALTAAAQAAAIGNPARTVETGVFGAQATFDITAQTLDLEGDADCEDSCSSVSHLTGTGARLSLRPFDALGLWGQASWVTDDMEGTEHSARGPMFSGGGTLVLPRHGIRPALAARAHYISTSAATNDQGISSDNQSMTVQGAALAVFGDDRGGGNLWLGPIATVYSLNKIALYSDDGSDRLSYAPRLPVGAVIGGEMISVSMSRYLRHRAVRMSSGLEARLIDTWGASGWIGITY